MDDTMFAILGFAGLILWGAVMAGTILHDVLRHKPRTLTTPAPDVGMTASGVPWVAGPQLQGYNFDELRAIARDRWIE